LNSISLTDPGLNPDEDFNPPGLLCKQDERNAAVFKAEIIRTSSKDIQLFKSSNQASKAVERLIIFGLIKECKSQLIKT